MILNDNDETNRQLIVMGNGFDLQCGMPTRYQDFFDYRFGISLQNKINQKKDVNSNARVVFYKDLTEELYPYFDITVGPKRTISVTYLDDSRPSYYPSTNKEKLQIVSKTQSFMQNYLQKIKEQITSKFTDPKIQKKFLNEWETISSINYSRWDTIFLLSNCFLSEDSIIQWNDVENIILKIVSIILLDDKKIAPDDLISDLTFKPNSSKRYFMFGVRNCFNESKNKVAIAMLNQLRIFEENFADYINKIRAESPNRYYRPSFELLTNLMHVQKENILDVLSFNYSLDKGWLDGFRQYFDNKYNNQNLITINSWSNIHGVAAYKDDYEKGQILAQSTKTIGKNIQLPAPIFGIDNHDILNPQRNDNFTFDDPRSIFTKSFRLLDNHVNNIRTNTFQKNVDVITFFGHSLNQADYSYFESIFDQYDIFHSNVKLEFYYYPGNDEVTAKSDEREVMKNVVKLLTSYGTTLVNEHGENIVNKLILEQRLSVLPNPNPKIN